MAKSRYEKLTKSFVWYPDGAFNQNCNQNGTLGLYSQLITEQTDWLKQKVEPVEAQFRKMNSE